MYLNIIDKYNTFNINVLIDFFFKNIIFVMCRYFFDIFKTV